MKSLGKYCKQIREDASLTQAQVSQAMGLTTPQYISNIERGLVLPSAYYIAKISEVTGTDAARIINRMQAVYKQRLLDSVNVAMKRL